MPSMSPPISTSAWCWKTSCGVRVVAGHRSSPRVGTRGAIADPRRDAAPARNRGGVRARIGHDGRAVRRADLRVLPRARRGARPPSGRRPTSTTSCCSSSSTRSTSCGSSSSCTSSVHLQRRLEAGEGPRALATVRRILTILKTVVAQIDVLETMTPGQFATFRARLDAASGFQSAQFRELEAVLGRRDDGALDAYEPDSPSPRADRGGDARGPRCSTRSLRYLHERRPRRPAAALERDVTRPAEPSEGAAARRSSRRTAATARRRRSPSAWSTSTRACRSGATAT